MCGSMSHKPNTEEQKVSNTNIYNTSTNKYYFQQSQTQKRWTL